MTLQTARDADALFATLAADNGETILGFFGEFSEVSRKTRPEFEHYCASAQLSRAFLVDVGETRSVHVRFGVTQVPTVLVVKGSSVLQKVVGAQTEASYHALLDGSTARASSGSGSKPSRASHHVIVYTTDTCPWCTRVKAYLRQNAVSFREVNVSRDERAAREMVQRSGQQGVPQLDIDGSVVVGFDKARIDGLLGLSGQKQS